MAKRLPHDYIMTKVQKRMGRPPRKDNPVAITVLLPGALRAWLRAQAAREMRDQGDVVTDGLVLYRKHVARRRRKK